MNTVIKYCENFGDLTISQGDMEITIDRSKVDDMLKTVKELRDDSVEDREIEINL